jgi:hypothetical protein
MGMFPKNDYDEKTKQKMARQLQTFAKSLSKSLIIMYRAVVTTFMMAYGLICKTSWAFKDPVTVR